MKRLQLAICCLAVLALRLPAEETRIVPFHRFGIASDQIGYANLIVTDVTGDTRPEIISCSALAALVVGLSGGTYGPLWHGPAGECTAVAAGDVDGDGATDILVASHTISSQGYPTGGKVKVFDPRGFGGARSTITLPGSLAPTDVAFGNVDFDATPEIVAITDTAVHVFDARTGGLQWSITGYGGLDVVLANLDDDPRSEIIVNDEGFASILDAGNEVLKWGYAGGFGQELIVGNVDADAKAEIVFPDGQQSYTEIVILNGDTFATSSFPYSSAPVGIGDANGDGANEIITGYGNLQGLRPSDGAVLWSHTPPESGIFGTVAVGDVDGDAKPEVVYGAGTSSYRDVLIVSDVVAKANEHVSLDLDGQLHSAAEDLDGDGLPELVIASQESDNNYHGGIVQIVDPRTRAVKGVLSATGLLFFNIYSISIGQLDADPAREIVALGSDFYDPVLVVWDAVTREIQWKSSEPPWGNPTFAGERIAVANIDGDAVDEIILGMTDGKLIVLNGASDIVQSSTVLSGTLADIVIADLVDDGTLEAVVATTSTLYLLDTADWSVIEDTPLESSVKRVDATAESGGRIAVTHINNSYTKVVSLYDTGLTPFWTCTIPGSTHYYYYSGFPGVRFVTLGSETRLFAGQPDGSLATYPITGGDACPTPVVIPHGLRPVEDIHFVDVTGDGRRELVVDTWSAVETDLIGLSTEPRGDTTGDGIIAATDVDTLADTLFGAVPGTLPGADVNADQRISPEDLFVLIHYEYAGGPELQP